MHEAIELIDIVLRNMHATGDSFELDENLRAQVSGDVRGLCRAYPMPYDAATPIPIEPIAANEEPAVALAP